jgi:hypothetical protein
MCSPGVSAAKGPAGRAFSSIPGRSARRIVSRYTPEKKTWKHLVTFRTITGAARLESPYSFIEDFRRDGESATQVHRALFGNGWIRDAAGKWTPLEKARFTASGVSWEAKETIDAGAAKDRFYLQTGGDTHMTTKLNGSVECRDHGKQPPEVPKE